MSDPAFKDISKVSTNPQKLYALDPETGLQKEPRGPLEDARHCWKKGRMEWMAGPVYYEQGNDYEVERLNPQTFQIEKELVIDNNRFTKKAYPMDFKGDAFVDDLGVDTTEQ